MYIYIHIYTRPIVSADACIAGVSASCAGLGMQEVESCDATEICHTSYMSKKTQWKEKRPTKEAYINKGDATEVRHICQKRRIERKPDIQKRPISIKRVVWRDWGTPYMSKQTYWKENRHTKEAYIYQKRWIYINLKSGATRLRYAKYVKRDVLKGKEAYKRGLYQWKKMIVYQSTEWVDATEVRQICQKRRIERKTDLQKRPKSIQKRWIYINPKSGATRQRYDKYVKRDALKGKETYKRGLYQSKESCNATEVRQIYQKRRIERKRELQKRPISLKKDGSISIVSIERVGRRDWVMPTLSKEAYWKEKSPTKEAYINQTRRMTNLHWNPRKSTKETYSTQKSPTKETYINQKRPTKEAYINQTRRTRCTYVYWHVSFDWYRFLL